MVTMSLAYAGKLSFIEDVGKVGIKEHVDKPHVLQEKETPQDKKASIVIHGLVDKVSFLDRQDKKEAILDKEPFQLKRRTLDRKSFEMVLNFNFRDGCGCPCTEIKVPIDFMSSTDCLDLYKDAILQRLRDTAIQDLSCGQNEVVERKVILSPKSEATVYGIVTNISQYSNVS